MNNRSGNTERGIERSNPEERYRGGEGLPSESSGQSAPGDRVCGSEIPAQPVDADGAVSPRNSGGDAMRLYVVLSRAHQWVSAHAYHDIRKSGMNTTEFAVLELLYHKGPQPLQQIGEKILISSGNITYVVDKLENKGLVTRRASPTDRRVIYADVTEQGRIFIEEKFPQHRQALEHAVSALTPEEQRQAVELLKKLGLSAQQSAARLT